MDPLHPLYLPTEHWRRAVAEEARNVASGEPPQSQATLRAEARRVVSGEVPPSQRTLKERYTSEMLEDIEEVLVDYAHEINGLARNHRTEVPSVIDAIRRVVLALNELQREYGRFDAIESSDLDDYIHNRVDFEGMNLSVIAWHLGVESGDLTAPWREW